MLKIHKNNFYFGENHNFFQVGNGCLEFDIRIRKPDGNPFTIVAPGNDIIRLVNNAFAYTIHDARISTSAGVEIEQNKYVGPISTIIRLVTQKMMICLHILIELMKVRLRSIIQH